MIATDLSTDECLRRLESVTAASGYTWFLQPRNFTRPNPLLRGLVGNGSAQVALFGHSLERDTFRAWFDGDVKPEPSGARLDGTIGLRTTTVWFLGIFVAVSAVVLLAVLLAGVVVIVTHGAVSAAPFLLGPLALATYEVLLLRAGRRSLLSGIEDLAAELRALMTTPGTDR